MKFIAIIVVVLMRALFFIAVLTVPLLVEALSASSTFKTSATSYSLIVVVVAAIATAVHLSLVGIVGALLGIGTTILLVAILRGHAVLLVATLPVSVEVAASPVLRRLAILPLRLLVILHTVAAVVLIATVVTSLVIIFEIAAAPHIIIVLVILLVSAASLHITVVLHPLAISIRGRLEAVII